MPQVSGQTGVVLESTPAPDQTKLSPDHTVLYPALQPQTEAHDNPVFSIESEKAYPVIVANGKDVPLATVNNNETFSNESPSNDTRF